MEDLLKLYKLKVFLLLLLLIELLLDMMIILKEVLEKVIINGIKLKFVYEINSFYYSKKRNNLILKKSF